MFKLVRDNINIPVVALFGVLAISVSGSVSLWGSTNASAAYQPPYKNPMSVRDDGCYSSLNSVSKITSIVGGASFGLVNAIVNTPVYDWDQNPSAGSANPLYEANDAGGIGGLRGELTGRSVGYAQDFSFKVTPVPNLYWMSQYFLKQLRYDAMQLVSIASGTKNPLAGSIGSYGNPFVANPFIYQQGAIIYGGIDGPGGIPRVPLFTGPITQADGGWLSSLNPSTFTNNITNMFGATNSLLTNNKDLINQLQHFDTSSLNGPIDGLATTLVDSPLFAPATVSYAVHGSNANDNCYESLTSSNKIPTYAFSVISTAVPVTIPGWLYSPITLLDGKGFSASGMTLYPPGSVNGKDMLDCYGRGKQPIVTPSGKWKLGDYTILYGGTGVAILTGWMGGIASYATNLAIANAIVAAAAAADAAAPGSGSSVATIALRLPAVETAYETYTSGFAFNFNLTRKTINMPTVLNHRVIDYNRSKMNAINYRNLIGNDGSDHTITENGKQFNPNIYVVLKKSYQLSPTISMNTDDYHHSPDGNDIKVTITTNKNGFNQGTNKTNNPYKPATNDPGGPTYNNNKDETPTVFSHARVYRIVMKPGVIPNAIDVDKLKDSSSQAPYISIGSAEPCSFLQGKLRDGDTTAQPSALTGDNANKDNDAFNAAGSYDCSLYQSKTYDIKMDEGVASDTLTTINEHIPAETPPGTKICYAVYYDSYTNDVKSKNYAWWNGTQYNYNSNYSAVTDTTYLSRAKCIVSGYKPSLQVRGGDLIVNGSVNTGTNSKEFLAGKGDPKETPRTYGSWVEYGVIASGSISGMSSGATFRLGLPPTLHELGNLSFANGRDSKGDSDYGKYTSASVRLDDGFSGIAQQFAAASDKADTTQRDKTVVDVASLPSGTYLLAKSGTVTITSSKPELDTNKSVILLAQDGTTINVASNIRIPDSYSSIGDISQVVITPATTSASYTLNVVDTVSHIDAWLVNPNGSINTCYLPGKQTTDIDQTPRAASGPCNNILQVNGPVAAKTLILRRNGGKDQSDDPNKLQQSIPGENFNLRPDAYLWAENHVDNASSKLITTNSIDLPPRY